MNADLLIRNFYDALSRNLLIYMIAVAVAAVATWGVWYDKRTNIDAPGLPVQSRSHCLGGSLIGAAYSYWVGIPAKLEANLVATQTNLEAARQAIVERYGAEQGVPHFRRLAIIWTVLSGVAIAAMFTFRRPVVFGICSAVLFLCLASFVLDLTAFMRDMTYTHRWMKLE